MRLLLDTDIALWAVVDDARLPTKARDLIGEPANKVFVSAASVWEISIKHALARGGLNDMPLSGAAALQYFRDSEYEMVGITASDAAAVQTLPMLHVDPFDRLLVAQALTVPFRLLTHDSRVSRTTARQSFWCDGAAFLCDGRHPDLPEGSYRVDRQPLMT